MGSAVGLSTDLHEGVMHRFRTLPMWRSAILVGRSLADLLTAVSCAVIVALTGLAWNPVSAVVAGTRTLWGNPNPSSTIHAWPMQHPVEAALIWSVGILAAAAPAASHFLKAKTTERSRWP